MEHYLPLPLSGSQLLVGGVPRLPQVSILVEPERHVEQLLPNTSEDGKLVHEYERNK